MVGRMSFTRWIGALLVAATIGIVGLAPEARAQFGQEQTHSEKFGPWLVNCTKELVFRYTFCNTYHPQTLNEGSTEDFVRFGVTRTHGSERLGINILDGRAAGTDILIRVDDGHSWKFDGTGDEALVASPAQSKEVIDAMLGGKTLSVHYTPAGGKPQEMNVSLAQFSAALDRARANAK